MNTAYPLFEFHGVPRDIHMDDPSGYLQVDTLTARSRSNEELRTVEPPESLNLSFSFVLILISNYQGRWHTPELRQKACQRRHRLDGLRKKHHFFIAGGTKDRFFDKAPFAIWIFSKESNSHSEEILQIGTWPHIIVPIVNGLLDVLDVVRKSLSVDFFINSKKEGTRVLVARSTPIRSKR